MPAPRPPAPAAADPIADPVETRARGLLAALAAGRWDHPETTFDPTMAAGLPPERVRDLWQSLEATAGTFTRVQQVELGRSGALRIANVTCAFQRLRKVVRVVFDADDRVAGLFLGPVPAEIEAKTRFLIDAVARGDFAAATRDFGAVMKSALPASKLEADWAGLQGELGPWRSIDAIQLRPEQGHWVSLASVRFARDVRVVRVVYDDLDEIVSLSVVAPEVPWTPPAYAKPDAFSERGVDVGTTPALPGTLTLPKGSGPFPAVVLVHGSGPNDRDESVGGVKVFRDLAWGLASHGIAVLRYEKRSRQAPMGVVTQKEEVIDGAGEALALLRRTPEIDARRIFLLGHSQGGTLAPRIAADQPELAGVIVLAGATRPLGRLLVEQFTYLSGLAPANASLRAAIEAARQFENVAANPALRPDDQIDVPGGGRLSGAYLLDDRGYDPRAAVAKLTCRLLFVQGLRDYQVTTADLDGWRAALRGVPRATFKTYPALNHLFVAGSGPPNPEEYQRPGHVDEDLIDDLANWILSD